MFTHDIVVIGASAGGIEALSHFVNELPSDLPVSIFVVVHFPTQSESILPDILSRKSALPAYHPYNREPIAPGRIYVAPPNYHLHLEQDFIRLEHGARENGFRPAIDPLFRSAACIYGPRVVGVLLSGSLDDGVTGLNLIHRSGGVILAQDPAEAIVPSLPLNAIENSPIDAVLSVEKIAQRIVELAHEPIDQEAFQLMKEDQEQSNRFIQDDMKGFEHGEQSKNQRTVLTCPECGGVIWEIREGDQVHYDCHVGHSYSSETMLHAQSAALEAALWTAVRTLEERAALIRRLAVRAANHKSHLVEKRFLQQADEAERDASIIRTLLERPSASGQAERSKLTKSSDMGNIDTKSQGKSD